MTCFKVQSVILIQYTFCMCTEKQFCVRTQPWLCTWETIILKCAFLGIQIIFFGNLGNFPVRNVL